MAISIDTVHQKVLAIANKEQRGYVTPQEFNLFASQAQLTIFEQYFYDIDKALEIHGNSTEYSDRISELHEKIAPFEKYNVDMSAVSGSLMTLPTSTTVYKLGTVFYNDSAKSIKVERVDAREAEMMQQTALYVSTQSRPVYVRRSATQLQFYPSSASPAYATSTVNCNYIAKPIKPNWTYVVINNQALFNSTASDAQDFQLHASEETQLVNKILELAGIVLNKPGLVQIAANEDNELMVKKK